MAKLHQVKLVASDKTFDVEESKSLLESLRSCGVYIKSSCGGHATCSDCLVVIKKGEENLLAPEFAETRLLGNVFHITKERLACQTKVIGDIEIDIVNHDQTLDEKRKLEKNNKIRSTQLRKKADKIAQTNADIEKDKTAIDQEKKYDRPGGNRRPKPFKFPKD